MARVPMSLARAKSAYQQQNAIANMLRQQSQQPVKSHSQGIANVLASFASAYLGNKAAKKYDDAQLASEQRTTDAIKAFLPQPGVISTRPRTEEEASAVGDIGFDDGLGAPFSPPTTLPIMQELSPYGKSAFALDTVPPTVAGPPNAEGVGVPMPDLGTTDVRGMVQPSKSDQLAAALSIVGDNPALGNSLLAAALKPAVTTKLGRGEVLLDASGKIIARGAQDPQSPAGKLAADYAAAVKSGNPGMIQFLKDAMRDPNKAFNPDGSPNLAYQAWKERLATKGQTIINLPKAELDRLKFSNKWVATATDPDQVQAARMSESSTSMMIDMLKDADDTVFQNAEFKANLSEWLSNAGLDSVRDSIFDKNGLIKIQSFKGLLTGQVLQRQLLQKGPQTESDAKRLMISLATLTNKNEANLVTLRALRALTANTLLRNEFAAEYEANNNTNKGVRKAWNDKLQGAPIYLEMRFKANKDGTAAFVQDANGKNTMIPDKKGKFRSYLFFDEYMEKTTQQGANGEFLTRQQKFDLWKNFVKQYKK